MISKEVILKFSQIIQIFSQYSNELNRKRSNFLFSLFDKKDDIEEIQPDNSKEIIIQNLKKALKEKDFIENYLITLVSVFREKNERLYFISDENILKMCSCSSKKVNSKK